MTVNPCFVTSNGIKFNINSLPFYELCTVHNNTAADLITKPVKKNESEHIIGLEEKDCVTKGQVEMSFR
jgi:hypothetical protein